MKHMILAAALLVATPALAQAPSVQVQNAWARATTPHAMSGGIFLTLTDHGAPDHLIGVSTPAAAGPSGGGRPLPILPANRPSLPVFPRPPHLPGTDRARNLRRGMENRGQQFYNVSASDSSFVEPRRLAPRTSRSA